MIRTYKIEKGQLVEAPESESSVFLVGAPTSEDNARLISEFGIDEHNLASTQDPNELPRLEQEEDHLAVIFKQPRRYTAKDNYVFKINAVGLFLFKDRLVIVAPEDIGSLEGRHFMRLANLKALFLRVLSSCIAHFISHLQVINEITDGLEKKLVTSMENRTLLLMFGIEKSLVYYVNAISANGRVIEKLKSNARNPETVGMDPVMADDVDDLAIDNAQCLEQAQVYANVLTGMMDARASIVNNNVSVLMKRLTVINVVFMPLNIIAGVCGMSEYTMMTKGIPWPAAYGVFMLGLIVIGFATYGVLRHVERRSVGA
jgi:magnesium transporter